MTARWFKFLQKIVDVLVVVPIGTSVYLSSCHEPLVVSIVLPFLRTRLWHHRGTKWVFGVERELSQVWLEGLGCAQSILRQCLDKACYLAGVSLVVVS